MSVPQDVFVSGSDGYGCFRIPVLLRLATGAIAAFAEARFSDCRDGGQRVDVVSKMSLDNGTSWSALRVVHSESNASAPSVVIGNPTPVRLPDGRVLIVVTRNVRRLLALTSTGADALSWGTALDLTSQVTNCSSCSLASGPAHGVLLDGGRLAVPAYGSAVGGAAALLSDDLGRTWRRSVNTVVGGGESALALAPNGSVLMLSRSGGGGVSSAVLQSASGPGGESWGVGAPMAAFRGMATCRGALLRVGSLLLYSHPGNVSDRGNRWNLTVWTSRDSGGSWAEVAQVEPPSLNASELAALHTAYSSLVQVNATHAAVLYERGPMGARAGAGEYQRLRWHAFPLPLPTEQE